MWYDKRSMKILFYLGVIVAIAGLAVYINPEFKNLGMLLVCVGVALVVIGFGGLIFNIFVENSCRNKKK